MKRIAETGECKKEEAPVPGRGLFLRASRAVNKTLYFPSIARLSLEALGVTGASDFL